MYIIYHLGCLRLFQWKSWAVIRLLMSLVYKPFSSINYACKGIPFPRDWPQKNLSILQHMDGSLKAAAQWTATPLTVTDSLGACWLYQLSTKPCSSKGMLQWRRALTGLISSSISAVSCPELLPEGDSAGPSNFMALAGTQRSCLDTGNSACWYNFFQGFKRTS